MEHLTSKQKMTQANNLDQKSVEEKVTYLKDITRSIPDYPKPGIIFRDLTTIFQDQQAMKFSLELLSALLMDGDSGFRDFSKFVAVEARGFILAGALSGRLGGGIVLARKPGKLPYESKRIQYQLEYGEDALEVHVDAIRPGERVVVVDDLLATGGTAEAACRLVEELGGEVARVIFLVELPELKGRERLKEYRVDSILTFEGL